MFHFTFKSVYTSTAGSSYGCAFLIAASTDFNFDAGQIVSILSSATFSSLPILPTDGFAPFSGRNLPTPFVENEQES